MTKTILLVEDNEQNRYLATFLLQRKGHRLIVALDGEEAIEKARLEKPDLILMDMQLPLLDGYEATKRIKAMTECAHIPVVAVTSFAMAGDREKALAIGCAGYVEKPYDPETFVKEIEAHLRDTPPSSGRVRDEDPNRR